MRAFDKHEFGQKAQMGQPCACKERVASASRKPLLRAKKQPGNRAQRNYAWLRNRRLKKRDAVNFTVVLFINLALFVHLSSHLV
jgi:hypothetical protein